LLWSFSTCIVLLAPSGQKTQLDGTQPVQHKPMLFFLPQSPGQGFHSVFPACTGELYRRFMFSRVAGYEHYHPGSYPHVQALKHSFVGAPWIAMLKLHFGSKHFHTPLNMEELRRQKKIKTQGACWLQFCC
jgi:hypothetical protein